MAPKKPYCQIIDGVPRCPGLEPDLFRDSLNFRAEKGDLVQCTYPKAGTHWVMYILELILKDGDPVPNHAEFLRYVRFVGRMETEGWRSPLPVRLFTTHEPLTKDTMNPEAKYVYVARNPWDTCVSFYHMATSLSMFKFRDGTFEEFFDAFMRGDFGYGDYFDHVASGYALRNEPNLLFLTYEDLKKDTRKTALKLAYFLGDRYGKRLEGDEDLLRTLLERTTAEYMQNVLVLDVQGVDPAWKTRRTETTVPDKSAYGGDLRKYRLVRRGKPGDWKSYFSPEQLRRVEAKICDRGRGARFMKLWKDIREETIAASLG
ncbi:3-alpha-hydroxysteroid sulfotransferase-like [Dermacentor silvarum]|uniref:3-alpha-hydroxysteroid sulfotransferase-like n=1 Tax=Dermacentor silvarum TaxID=543639 RepID=UPI00189A62A4|nr:3-alpha-hydroxysteroid sulfotransferase-like [Dermacentor silvarum]XP_049520969.1 3-alpha-hydroxysteroid sulfotransferase-like [Dermacentor silvarum]